MFDRVLIANRGEIAVRIIRTLRRLGIGSVAVYSAADRDATHVRMADMAVAIGPAAAAASYLRVDRVVAAAVACGVDAVHPGYGFLSERPALPQACADAGVTFVGPPVAAIAAMGDKARARRLMRAAGVPVVTGTDDADLDDAALAAASHDIGYPLIVKPVAGGGGKGMVVVDGPDDLPAALTAARRVAAAAFGDDRVLLERFVADPRHIEVQVLADDHGAVVAVGERECSLQRRHQKVVEEAPAPRLDDAARARLSTLAVTAAHACGYRNAGTVECIVPGDAPDKSYFLEMNTRLQVEHPVTEAVTGLDLVEWQLRIAAGESLTFGQADIETSGHAVEARIYAEDPRRDFLPTGGTVLAYRSPGGDGVRVDAGIATGTQVPTLYDPLLAKVVAHGSDRAQALRRLDTALADTVVLGMGTNVGFMRRLLSDDDVRAGRLDTGLIARRLGALTTTPTPDHVLATAALSLLVRAERDTAGGPFDRVDGWRLGEGAWTRHELSDDAGGVWQVRWRGAADAANVCIGDQSPFDARIVAAAPTRPHPHPRHPSAWLQDVRATFDGSSRRYDVVLDGSAVWVGHAGDVWRLDVDLPVRAARAVVADGGPVHAPMPGTVVSVEVVDGQQVAAGTVLVVLEAMKMEHPVTAPVDGRISDVAVGPGQQVAIGHPLLRIEPS